MQSGGSAGGHLAGSFDFVHFDWFYVFHWGKLVVFRGFELLAGYYLARIHLFSLDWLSLWFPFLRLSPAFVFVFRFRFEAVASLLLGALGDRERLNGGHAGLFKVYFCSACFELVDDVDFGLLGRVFGGVFSFVAVAEGRGYFDEVYWGHFQKEILLFAFGVLFQQFIQFFALFLLFVLRPVWLFLLWFLEADAYFFLDEIVPVFLVELLQMLRKGLHGWRRIVGVLVFHARDVQYS